MGVRVDLGSEALYFISEDEIEESDTGLFRKAKSSIQSKQEGGFQGRN